MLISVNPKSLGGGGGEFAHRVIFLSVTFFSPGFFAPFSLTFIFLSSRRVSKKKPSKSTKSVDRAINVSSRGPKIADLIFAKIKISKKTL